MKRFAATSAISILAETLYRMEEVPITRRVYDHYRGAVGGRDAFYSLVKRFSTDNNLAVPTKRECWEFLQRQEAYQLTRRVIKMKTVNALTPRQPNRLWEADLMDMTTQYAFNGFQYILSVIDIFSKYAYAAPLRARDATTVADAMRLMLDQVDGGFSGLIQTDNGSEFMAGQLLRDRRITHRSMVSSTFSALLTSSASMPMLLHCEQETPLLSPMQ
jgi:hypothetical protein